MSKVRLTRYGTALCTVTEVSMREDSKVVVIVEVGGPNDTPERVELKIGDSIEVGLTFKESDDARTT